MKMELVWRRKRLLWQCQFMLLSPRASRDSLQWRHNERYGVWNHQRLDCLLKRLFRRRSKKTSKLRVTGVWGEFTGYQWIPAQMTSNAENVSIWWRLHNFASTIMSWVIWVPFYRRQLNLIQPLVSTIIRPVKYLIKLLIHPQTSTTAWECINNFITLYNWFDYLSMLKLRLILVSERGPLFTQALMCWSLGHCAFVVGNMGHWMNWQWKSFYCHEDT